MPDMLVKLYELPDAKPYLDALTGHGISIRRAIAPEKRLVVGWARTHFSPGWGDECDVAMSRQPASCFVAQKDGQMLGFACYDATKKGFFGPTAVSPDTRGLGVGAALLIVSLQAMLAEGYAYAIIGGAGPTEFYAKIVNALAIEGSSPGIYRNMLRD